MGERVRRAMVQAFQHRGDAAYERRLASPDLLTNLKTDTFATEIKCDPVSAVSPTAGERVVLYRMEAGKLSVVRDNRLVGTVDAADASRVGAAVDAVGGAITGRVQRNAAIGSCFTVRIDVPGTSDDE